MENIFVFYLDDVFFSDGLNFETIKNFRVLFEVPLQTKILTIYNKEAFQNAMEKIKEDGYKPSIRNKIKDVFRSFKGVDNFIFDEDKINICLSKHVDNNQFNSALELWTFINSKLPKRNFNVDYAKHGRRNNNGTLISAWIGESQLYTTNEESQSLLNSAIFDLRKRASFYVNFDDSINDNFILFPAENTILNTFHAFHLEKKFWNEKIPNSIIKYFNK